MPQTTLSTTQRVLLNAAIAFIGYGSWAMWANHQYGLTATIKAGLTQGSYSFFITLVMTVWIEAAYAKTKKLNWHQSKPYISPVITIVTTCGLTFTGSWWVNVLAGTPEIFTTVLPGYIIGTLYVVGYVANLLKNEKP